MKRHSLLIGQLAQLLKLASKTLAKLRELLLQSLKSLASLLSDELLHLAHGEPESSDNLLAGVSSTGSGLLDLSVRLLDDLLDLLAVLRGEALKLVE